MSKQRVLTREDIAHRLARIAGHTNSLKLSAGDMVPADVRLLTARDLFINQSAFTGKPCQWKKWPAI